MGRPTLSTLDHLFHDVRRISSYRYFFQMPTQLEVNFHRLMSKMEEMAEAKLAPDDWRFEKYLKALRNQFNDLNKESGPGKPAPERLKHLKSQVEFLEGYWASQKAPSVEERSRLTSSLVPPLAPPSKPEKQTTIVAATVAPEFAVASTQSVVRHRTTDIATRSRNEADEEMRRELFGSVASECL